MTSSESGAWQSIPRRALARGGPPRRDAILLLRAAAMVGVAGAAAWFGWALVRPLPSPTNAPLPPLSDLPRSTPSDPMIDQRQSVVAALGQDNVFAHDRRSWERAAAAVEDGEDSSVKSPATKPGEKPTARAARAKESADESRKVAELFALRQIYARRDGVLVARLSLLKSPDPENSVALVVDDEFKEGPNADASWTLTQIDRTANTVTIERGSQSATLNLFSGSVRPLEAPSSIAAAPVVATIEPDIQLRSRDEIIADLRAANVADADIAALLALLNEQPDLAKPPVSPAPAAAPVAGAKAPPPGLEGVLRMMGQQQKKAAGAKPAEVDASSKAE